MNELNYQIIDPNDDKNITLIAQWYQMEWNIPVTTTKSKIENLSADNKEFQFLMTIDDKPIATGGLYNKVGLLDREPRLNIYKNWLALVYSKPEIRGKGYGVLLCKHIQEYAKLIGLDHLYLFTHTAEKLYRRLEWQELERLFLDSKDIVIMKKKLN